jgi:hypothetical protein
MRAKYKWLEQVATRDGKGNLVRMTRALLPDGSQRDVTVTKMKPFAPHDVYRIAVWEGFYTKEAGVRVVGTLRQDDYRRYLFTPLMETSI